MKAIQTQKDYFLVHLNGEVRFNIEAIASKIVDKSIYKAWKLEDRLTGINCFSPNGKQKYYSYLESSLLDMITYSSHSNGMYSNIWKRKLPSGEILNQCFDTLFYDEFLFLVQEDLVEFDGVEMLTEDDIWRNFDAANSHTILSSLYAAQTAVELKKAYRKLAMELHPDKTGVENDDIKLITVTFAKLLNKFEAKKFKVN